MREKKRIVAEKGVRVERHIFFSHLKKFIFREGRVGKGEIGKEDIHFWSEILETTQIKSSVV